MKERYPLIVLKCSGCHRLRDLGLGGGDLRCVHCGHDKVEPLVMLGLSTDQPIEVTMPLPASAATTSSC
jgi:hypothetical protein